MENRLKNLTKITIFSITFLSFIDGEKKILGRPVWHNPKKIFSKKLDAGDCDQQIFDLYSISHINGGILFYFIDRIIKNDFFKKNKFNLCIFSSIIFEILENQPYIYQIFTKNYKNYKGDSIVNIIADIYLNVLGYYLAFRFKKNSVIYLILTEILIFKYYAGFFSIIYIIFKKL